MAGKLAGDRAGKGERERGGVLVADKGDGGGQRLLSCIRTGEAQLSFAVNQANNPTSPPFYLPDSFVPNDFYLPPLPTRGSAS